MARTPWTSSTSARPSDRLPQWTRSGKGSISLPPNASVNVQIVTGEKNGALAIPRAALFREGDSRFVYRLEDGRARRRDVSVGLVGLNDVEVTSGLKENDPVILPGTVPLSDGLRVRTTTGRD